MELFRASVYSRFAYQTTTFRVHSHRTQILGRVNNPRCISLSFFFTPKYFRKQIPRGQFSLRVMVISISKHENYRLFFRTKYVGVSGATAIKVIRNTTGTIPQQIFNVVYSTHHPTTYTNRIPKVTINWIYDPSSPVNEEMKNSLKCGILIFPNQCSWFIRLHFFPHS